MIRKFIRRILFPPPWKDGVCNTCTLPTFDGVCPSCVDKTIGK